MKVRFLKPGLARVRVQSTLYGLTLDGATGTAILQDGRWKVAEGASTGTHVGRLLVRTVPSSSMAPTLHPGSTILLDPAAYRHTKPRIGDIVVFHPPAGAISQRCGKRPPAGQACAQATPRNSTVGFTKRIVARPGDRK